MIWLLTCEHYSNELPPQYAHLFLNAVDVLESHRGYDLQAAPLFTGLESLFDQSFHYPYSRLLVEPNRSLHHSSLFSPFTATLGAKEKAEILSTYYQAYRKSVEEFIANHLDQEVMHISVHSFTAVFKNQDRRCPVGILFDSRNKAERSVAEVWKKCFKDVEPSLGIRYNYPYRGNADGFTTYLRKIFPKNYYGYELEVRNDMVLDLSDIVYNSIVKLRKIIG